MNTHINNTYQQAFFVVPAYIMHLEGLTLGFLKVYEAIFQFWNHNKSCFLSEKALMEKSKLQRSHVYNALNFFERLGELKRVQKGTKRYIIKPEKIIETDCVDIKPASAAPDYSTNIAQPSTGVDIDVHSSGRDPSTGVDTNVNNLNKEIKKLTTQENPVSSDFFSVKLKSEILELKLERDPRNDEEFLEAAQKHVETASNPRQYHLAQRKRGVVNLLKVLYSNNVLFNYEEPKTKAANQGEAIVPLNETDEERKNRIYIQNEFEKERYDSSYKSKVLEIERKMERDKPNYKSKWLAMGAMGLMGDKYANAG